MSLLTTTDVAPLLGIDESTEGLQSAIDQAESLVAGKLGLASLEYQVYTDEERIITYNTQQILPKHGPIQTLTAFTYDGDDKLADVIISQGGWAIVWDDPYGIEFDRVKSFERMKKVKYTYGAGWNHPHSAQYPVPAQVAEYVKSLAGLTMNNLLASGVYDTKLGDMTIKMQRETLAKNLEVYDAALAIHARPYY